MEPFDKADLSGDDDSLRMKLKLQDSSEGLSDKDICGLTKMFHVAPTTFSTMVFGATSSLVTAIRQWVAFLSKGCLQPTFRRLMDENCTLPTKIGWLIECRIQSFLKHCAISTTATEADDGLHLLAFDMFQHMLKDGIHLGLQSCDALTLSIPKQPSTPPAAALRNPTHCMSSESAINP